MWLFDRSRHLVIRDGEEHRLEPKAAAVLARLVESRGEVVTREELLDAAWSEQYVGEEVLTNAVYQIRKALDDDARDPQLIETVPKRGYRLIRALGTEEKKPPASARKPRRPSSWKRHRWIAAVLAGLLLAIVGGSLAHRSPGSAGPVPNPSHLVTRGWTALEAPGPDGAEEAAVLAREALALDPADPDGWALLATATAARAAAGDPSNAPDRFAEAQAAGERALALDPGHPLALGARARARWLGAWDWAGAERDLRAALTAAPESASLRVDLAELLLFSGRLAEAKAAVGEALARSPESARARMTAGLVASLSGERDAAAREYREVLARQPDHRAARIQLTKLDRGPAQATPEIRLERLLEKGRLRPGHLALWYLDSGDDHSALAWLDRAVGAHDPTILFFRFDSRWDRLRDHPRYRAAMERAGILPSAGGT